MSLKTREKLIEAINTLIKDSGESGYSVALCFGSPGFIPQSVHTGDPATLIFGVSLLQRELVELSIRGIKETNKND